MRRYDTGSTDGERLEKLRRRCSEADILFMAPDGMQMAPARTRAHGFARELGRRGYRTEVVSLGNQGAASEESSHHAFNDWPGIDRFTMGKVIDAFDVIAGNNHAVLYAQKADLNLLAIGMAKLANGNKTVLDYDDNELEVFFLSRRLSELLPDLHPRHILQKFASQADLCIAASEMLQHVLSTYNEKTHLIYTAIDTLVFDHTIRERARPAISVDPLRVNVIWPGSVWNRAKAQEVVLIVHGFLAMNRAVRERAVLNLLGYGSAWPLAKEIIGDLMRDHDAAGSVRLHEFVPPNAMPDVLAAMDIGLVNHQGNPQAGDRPPTKMFEYMAMGLAVCAGGSGEPGHILEDGVTGYLADDAQEFTDKLQTLIADGDCRRRMAEAGRALVNEKYTMMAAGDQLERALQPLI